VYFHFTFRHTSRSRRVQQIYDAVIQLLQIRDALPCQLLVGPAVHLPINRLEAPVAGVTLKNQDTAQAETGLLCSFDGHIGKVSATDQKLCIALLNLPRKLRGRKRMSGAGEDATGGDGPVKCDRQQDLEIRKSDHDVLGVTMGADAEQVAETVGEVLGQGARMALGEVVGCVRRIDMAFRVVLRQAVWVRVYNINCKISAEILVEAGCLE
jgi:hypothetical protein